MKRILSLLLVLAALCSFGLAFAQEDAAAEIPAAVQEMPAEETEAEPAADGLTATAQALFSSIGGKNYSFATPAGGVYENFTVNTDGTFSGSSKDSDAAVCWLCSFSGTFDHVTKISDYEYTVRIASMTSSLPSEYRGLSYYKYRAPIGFEQGYVLHIYLPGMEVSKMADSDNFSYGLRYAIGNEKYLQYYAMYSSSATTYYYAEKQYNNNVTASGWYQDSSGSWYYYVNNSPVKDIWKKIGGSWYYFGSDGKMYSNQWNGNYYLKSGGTIAKGWCQIDGSWYYFNSNGYKQTGWKKISNTWYYLGTDGRMYSSEWYGDYYLQSGGAMARGWCKIDGNWYYFNSSGYKQTGWKKVSGRWYYLDPENDGIMVYSQTMTIDGVDYTFNSSGCWVS